ncbi:erythritol/L-threitol dehydrogenase [Clostridium sp. AF19-22AC]|jgi:2-desacetyl-2-hydroxyethyl bacteriochlorophyllide A dehydrogenase|uniref:alcohol dehydrogenase catalytic domain-containing protein n=1 Tax=Clostridia TaxID=186801 RepID=UPI000E4B54DA|nr:MULTISPECIES: alcohol dehydrogenase catalytic domain-containing protein [Clostridia]RHR21874.1 erythritol/L-threitol dehydrogenase [Clostridium sp. AF19-22AC]
MMKETMKALRMHAPYDFRYEDVPVPEIDDDEILVKIEGCGICAGDVKTYHGGVRVWGTAPENRYIEAPVIGGHEFVGRVVQFGKNVTGVNIGDHMVSEQMVPCGECRFCKAGYYSMCQRHYIYGFKKEAQGGFAEYMKFSKEGIHHKIPEEMTLEQAVLIEPLACAMHAVERAKIQHNDVVVISGLGAIGLGMVSVARKQQPRLIIGLDLRQKRLDKALKCGADIVFNPMEVNVGEEIRKLTEGYGCDVYIEASGSEKSVVQGMDAIRFCGRYVQFGVFPKAITIDWNDIGDGKEIEIYGAHLGPYCYEPVMKSILDGSIYTEGLISHAFKMEDWKEAFEVAEKDPDAFKVMLIP